MNKSMSWSGHIQEIINKASKTLNFAKRILHQCTSSVKETAYITLVRPILEYASVVWDPHQQYIINNIEMIQRRAARWVKQDYRLTSSVSDMINDLQWTTLQKRSMYSRLIIFKIDFYIKTHQLSRSHSIIYITPCLTLPIYHTMQQRFIPPTTSTNYYQKSFFPHTIADWNNLPDEIIDSTSLDDFSYHLKFL